ncbi:MAG: DUF1538 domain-containing protein [Burkholderiales bacterium]|nr:DUF1538 domain-containing protein [Burkholderiales bacterium]
MSFAAILEHLGHTAFSVFLAVLPLIVLFLLFQVFFLGLPVREVTRVLTGTLLASVGLFLFLLGVSFGFLPFGRAIGETLGRLPQTWLMAACGALLGFVTTWGEPAVRILAHQVEEASAGSIRAPVVVATVCTGVGVWMGIAMLRISYGIPLTYLVVPGYLLVLVLIALTRQEFAGIAADASGVATGPLANTFLLALGFGASSALGQDPLASGLGLVALIALAPLMSIMTLGAIVRWKERAKESQI